MSGIGAGFAALSITQKLARIGIAIGIFLLIVGLIWWRIDAYGDSREEAGVNKERAAWVEAGEKLKADAAKSATRADDLAVKRLEEHKEQIDEDRKAVEQAVENGTSPLDALFGG